MALVEDASAFLTDFGVDALVGGASVRSLFDAAYADAFGLVAGTAAPALTCASADVAAVETGAAVTVNATAYTVAEVQPDGTGITRLILQTA